MALLNQSWATRVELDFVTNGMILIFNGNRKHCTRLCFGQIYPPHGAGRSRALVRRARARSASGGASSLITLTTKDTEETLRDAQSCAPGRFENFLRDGGQHRLVYCGKGLDFVVTAIFKAKSKNAGAGDRTVHLEVRNLKSTRDRFSH